MEISENRPEFNISPTIEKELGPESLNNVLKFAKAVKTEAQERQIEAHLMIVGGNVKPEKQGKHHKDVDMVLYSPQLYSENLSEENNYPKFDAFASFISDVAKKLDWQSEKEDPYFYEYSNCWNGKVILQTNKKPIEVMPVFKNRLSTSFENYRKTEINPIEVIF
jgi:hypothetical protein